MITGNLVKLIKMKLVMILNCYICKLKILVNVEAFTIPNITL